MVHFIAWDLWNTTQLIDMVHIWLTDTMGPKWRKENQAWGKDPRFLLMLIKALFVLLFWCIDATLSMIAMSMRAKKLQQLETKSRINCPHDNLAIDTSQMGFARYALWALGGPHDGPIRTLHMAKCFRVKPSTQMPSFLSHPQVWNSAPPKQKLVRGHSMSKCRHIIPPCPKQNPPRMKRSRLSPTFKKAAPSKLLLKGSC